MRKMQKELTDADEECERTSDFFANTIVCSAVHDKSLHASRSSQKYLRGFTLIELLVVIAVISLLVSVLLPSLNRAKDLARRVGCQTNLKQMGTCLYMYAADHKGWLTQPDSEFSRSHPGAHSSHAMLYPDYTSNASLFVCPGWKGNASYTGKFGSDYANAFTKGRGVDHNNYRSFMFPQGRRKLIPDQTDAFSQVDITEQERAIIADAGRGYSDADGCPCYFNFYHTGQYNILQLGGQVSCLPETIFPEYYN